ncbi:GNAT family N-acetyltransferase [Sutcliffiella halmapala]|uniref:GNAT family N-acetyltransferase n=1 Tax=Sutcliffiella halmapala TaxID=79882 RepID=UPI000995A548|nr:GNAT family N-acetyltransferase [Sutcliffiella halmapala]
MLLRNIQNDDFLRVSTILNAWWGGRNMVDMLPRLFFNHFQETSFIVEDEGRTMGFLIGFVSPTRPEEAYIHFVGVNPSARQKNIGRDLYEHFFKVVRFKGCQEVSCVTSPINTTSIKFHQKLGFSMKTSDHIIDGLPIHLSYDGVGEDRVVFVRSLV